MNKRGRASYNRAQQQPGKEMQAWQVADYRKMDLGSLFKGLDDLGIVLDESHFKELSSSLRTPEELAFALVKSETEREKVYLLVFELWRRLTPHLLTLSIFCDELDHQINRYNQGDLTCKETLPALLAQLEKMLMQNLEESEEAPDVFALFNEFSSHDLGGFLYDFITDQIDTGCLEYAKMLYAQFSPYMGQSQWFALLQAQILPQRQDEIIQSLIQRETEQPEVNFLLELALFLAKVGNKSFCAVALLLAQAVQTEEDFQALTHLALQYYKTMGNAAAVAQLEKIHSDRMVIEMHQVLERSDPSLGALVILLGGKLKIQPKPSTTASQAPPLISSPDTEPSP